MFEDLRNTDDDHFVASSGLIPEHSPLINLDVGDEGGDSEDVSSEEEEVTPPPKGKEIGLLVPKMIKERGLRQVMDNGCKIKLVKWYRSMRGLQRQSSQWLFIQLHVLFGY
jgi:hypothetical protein